MKYITTRIALEAFEYDPHGFKPEWFLNMKRTGNAYTYEETKQHSAGASVFDANADIGDRIYLDEFGKVGVYKANEFARYCKPIDFNRDTADSFVCRVNQAVYGFNSNIIVNKK